MLELQLPKDALSLVGMKAKDGGGAVCLARNVRWKGKSGGRLAQGNESCQS